MKRGYIIPHTHWDREWRYPIWENRQYLIELMEELLDNLRDHPGYNSFLTDGQSVMLLDFLELRPERREELVGYIQAGRLHIGPWYTLPDLYPVSGESLVRNLQRGSEVCQDLGGIMKIGYESFGWGQPSQLPQLYQGFGIDTVIVSKNVDKTRAPNCEFWWEGKDGTRVLATRLGDDARANFFMNTTIEVMNGAAYKGDEYVYDLHGMGSVYHQADQEGHTEDYFRIEDTQRLHPERVREAVLHSWAAMDDTLLPDDRAMMNGTDSTGSQYQLTEMLALLNQEFAGEIEFSHSSLPEYVALLKEKLPTDRMVTLQGELRDGPATSLSANALMTRPHIKTLNKKAQRHLFDTAEPLGVALTLAGGRYDTQLLKKAEDYLLLAHPHDSINGVTQDKTVEDVLYRLNQALELAKTSENTACKGIITRMDTSWMEKDDLVLAVFNPLPYPRREVVKVYVDTPRQDSIWDFALEDSDGNPCAIQHLSRIEKTVPVSDMHSRPWPFYCDRHEVIFEAGELPAGGYKLYRLTDKSKFARTTEFWAKTRKTKGDELAASPTAMENQWLAVTVNPNGTVDLLDKATGNLYSGLNRYRSTGDVGDYWIYYPPYNNQTYDALGCAADIWLEENGPLSATIAVRIVMNLPEYGMRPEKYIASESRRSDNCKPLEIVTRYTLRAGARSLAVECQLQNTVCDHRMSVWFDTGIDYRTVDAEGHFCVDRRGRLPLRDSQGSYFNELTPQPMQSFVSVENGSKGFGIVTDCIGEYDVQPVGTQLGLTLFRAVKNIICTEMRSAGSFPQQQGGQLLDEHLCYRYAIYPFTGSWEQSGIADEAARFTHPVKPVQIAKARNEGGTLGKAESFYSVEGGLSVTAIRRTPEGSVVVRGFNPYSHAITATVRLRGGIRQAWATKLDGERLHQLETEDGRASAEVAPHKIITIELV